MAKVEFRIPMMGLPDVWVTEEMPDSFPSPGADYYVMLTGTRLGSTGRLYAMPTKDGLPALVFGFDGKETKWLEDPSPEPIVTLPHIAYPII